jgi:hypothetical protein
MKLEVRHYRFAQGKTGFFAISSEKQFTIL